MIEFPTNRWRRRRDARTILPNAKVSAGFADPFFCVVRRRRVYHGKRAREPSRTPGPQADAALGRVKLKLNAVERPVSSNQGTVPLVDPRTIPMPDLPVWQSHRRRRGSQECSCEEAVLGDPEQSTLYVREVLGVKVS